MQAAKLPESVIQQLTSTGHIDGQCHCGQIKLRLNNISKKDLLSAVLCNCSICAMHGALTISVLLEDLEILEGNEEDKLAEYRFNTGVARHFFCKRCGIYTHHKCRNMPEYFAVNVGCLHDLSPFDYREVPILEAKSFHPKDTGEPKKWLGKWKMMEPNEE